ncbi:MAG: arylesterase [Phenylobacterium sp. RIFCSPHIGHO2_01_FULL_69_31]|jgi:acyl-CoA thioesterase-1|uniref:arylesterase n=1 Tax=Phenylobacterium sp. RIFCSPHIGHO2_01_FULL_69_31 TaxID=1801944 RepID=UPI0008D5AFCB|nr:arylesterase [Phenylobacterium sp. RIFCSPHIGHO2_01_FULL_69_31]OHB32109.1 MAG: arylesterase [Phenylobacterium sp. RIFCSPHIGHO2_01_FULL_69_31]
MAEPRPTRRALFALPLIAVAAPAVAAPPRVVTVLGDSITAGFGLPAAQAVPAQLQLALRKLGLAVQVRAAGVSGDTTAGGLARVDFSVRKDTDLAVVALGANDLLQGQDPKRTRANLDGIIRKLKARRIGVVLTGISAPIEIGGGYARDFNAIFPGLARTHGVPLYPNLLDGVARRPALNQPDGIHPNARGAQIIAARLAPVVAKALAAKG